MDSVTVLAIVDAFGGIRPMAKALGHRSHTTVQRWRDEGFIPHWRNTDILTAARKKKIKITREQLRLVNRV